MAISAVLSLLIAGAMLLAVSDCLRSCSRVELSKVLGTLAEKAAEAESAARNGEPESSGEPRSDGSTGSSGGIGGNNSAGDGKSSGGAQSSGAGSAVRVPKFPDACVPLVLCSAVGPLFDPCARTLRDVPKRR